MATGTDLRQLRTERGYSYRRAATVLGCSLSTLQRWEAADSVSDDLLATLRNAGYQDTTPEGIGYQVGRLVAIAESMMRGPETHPNLTAIGTLAQRIARSVGIIHLPANAQEREPLEPVVEDIMRRIPPVLPEQLTPEIESAYWLGYYHERADRR